MRNDAAIDDAGSALTVGELVATPSLGLRFLAGGEGADRVVTWTHISDLDDPARWLDGGELLITNGLSLPDDVDGQVEYLTKLHHQRAAALAIGVRGPVLHTAFLQEADRRGFPVLHVAKEVPFQSISRLVAAAAGDDEARRFQVHIRVFDALRLRASGEYSPADLFRRLETITGYSLSFVTRDGIPVIEGTESAPTHVAEALSLTSSDSGPPNLMGGVAVRVPLRPGVDGFVVALERKGTKPAGLGAIHHVSTIVALEVAEIRRMRAEQRRRGAELLSEVVSGHIDPSAVESRLRDEGFAPNEALIVATIAPADPAAVDELHHRLADHGAPQLLLGIEDFVLVVCPAEPDVLTKSAQGLTIRGGVSLPRIGLGDLASARREATWAMNHGEGTAFELQRYTHEETSNAWMPTDLTALRELVERILGPLLSYDHDRDSAMVNSLRVYFSHDRRMASAAEALFIHKHTLAYRLRRVEEITGRDLNQMSDMVELWLALRALDTLNFEADQDTLNGG